MKLDFNPATGAYLIRVPRSNAAFAKTLQSEHGFDFSTTASHAGEAVLFTREPYAAATFSDIATPVAAQSLSGIVAQIERSRAATSDRHYKTPLGKELWGFQKADLDYALDRTHTLIGDQPGLGKTPVAITYANEIDAKDVLVVCPANIRLQWAQRISEWSTMIRPYISPLTNGRHGPFPTDTTRVGWNIVSYDLARTPAMGAALARGRYSLLILDEAHYVKSVDSKRTRAIFGGGKERSFDALVDRSDRVLALTGTPLPNRPREAYTLCRGLCFDAIDWMSEDRFKDRFNPSVVIAGTRADGSEYRRVDERSGRHAELQNRLRGNFMVRHLKREVMTQLKMPVYDLIQVEATGAVKQALQAESLLHIDPETLEGADAEVLGHVAEVRQQMGIALAPQVAEYVNMLIDGGESKLVVFAWHIEVLNILERAWKPHGCLRIDGRTSPTRKQELIDEFRRNPKFQIILGNIQSMGTGTDGLQDVASHGLVAEPPWTPGELEQCGSRLDRGGQRAAVQLDTFVAPGSFAERILAGSLRKLHVTNAALDKRLDTSTF